MVFDSSLIVADHNESFVRSLVQGEAMRILNQNNVSVAVDYVIAATTEVLPTFVLGSLPGTSGNANNAESMTAAISFLEIPLRLLGTTPRPPQSFLYCMLGSYT